MKPKKTISERLTNKYQLVIRNEDNFAEKTSFGFTYAKFLLMAATAFLMIFVGSLFLSKTLLSKWFDPKYEQTEQNKKLYGLAIKVDSLSLEVDRKDLFIQNLQRILSGDTTSGFVDPVKLLGGENMPVKKTVDLKLTAVDSQFRREFEQNELSVVSLNDRKYRELQGFFFFTPISGFVSDKYDAKKLHFGVDIVAKTNEPVKCVAEGTVVLASWTQDSGYVIAVQHRGNLVSVYKHNAGLLKKVGSFVNSGEIISIVGNSGEMTDGSHLHFELWHNGNSLDPQEFVTF
ncbi:MAG: M23 family metallopeptidase [Cyclobacteriaceae bacterium]|nr:M23 family metallopeptidase [Cyclobacteriaceae bacterium]